MSEPDDVRRFEETRVAVQLLAAEMQVRHAEQAGVLLTRIEGHFNQAEATEQRVRRNAVLVVDDYGTVREVIAEVLRYAGFVVRTAANGLEGLLAAHEMRPAVVVMDLNMPVLDGITATTLISANEAMRETRVIAYSSKSGLEDRLVQTLFTAVVGKPATPEAVLATSL